MSDLNRQSHTYTPLFCEENIWKLIEAFYTNKQAAPIATPVDVIFIINRSNSVAIFNQLASKGQQPVIWDYHVILSAFVGQQRVIFDFDSRCAFPTTIQAYFSATFPQQCPLKEQYQPTLKTFPAKTGYQLFSSDRSHMKGVIPESEFPTYDIIQPTNASQKLSLQTCIDINHSAPESKLFMPYEYYEHFLQLTPQ